MPKIAVLPGDGIGPEIIAEGLKVLHAAAEKYHLQLDVHEALVGGAAYDQTGHPLPPETLELVQSSDAVYFGAVGGPKYDAIPNPDLRPERGALLPLRKKLSLYANLRPCVLYPSLASACPLRPDLVEGGFDILVVRELTGGLYFGARTRTDDRASDECVYTTEEIERVAHVAFRAAQGRRKRVASIDKANVMETSRLWRETVTRVAAAYPDVALEHGLVDSAAMRLIQNPKSYDVILTENMFGDILSDEASVLCGSIGLLGSASLGDPGRPGLFEPIHGSAPDLAGKSLANPVGAIRAAASLLRDGLGLSEAAAAVEAAVARVIAEGELTGDLGGGSSTTQVAERIAAAV